MDGSAAASDPDSEPSSPTAPSAASASRGEGAVYTYTLCLVGDWPDHTSALRDAERVHEIPIELDAKIAQVACGSDWICLLTESGRAYSLGGNSSDQLARGNSTAPWSSTLHPLAFSWTPQRRISRIACGSTHGGFVLETGELFMFGRGTYGQLGTGDRKDSSVPVPIHMSWLKLLAGKEQPTVANSIPITFNGLMSRSSTARRTSERDGEDDGVFFTDISCGDRHTLVLARRRPNSSTAEAGVSFQSTSTSIIAFGDGLNGRLGLGHEGDSLVGALVSNCVVTVKTASEHTQDVTTAMSTTVTGICAGASHNLAITAAGHIFSWGNGVHGQLGHGSLQTEWLPRQIACFATSHLQVVAMRCGASHSVALTRSGTAFVWGRGSEGQLGRGIHTTADVATPQQIVLPMEGFAPQAQQDQAQLQSDQRAVIKAVAARQHSTLALDDHGRMFGWGDNTSGKLGIPTADTDGSRIEDKAGEPRIVAQPKQVWFMELRSSSHPVATSKVAALRRQLTTVGLTMPRLSLEHVEVGDTFTLLVFKTKPMAVVGSTVAVSVSDAFSQPTVSAPPLVSVRERERAASAKPRTGRQPPFGHDLDPPPAWNFSLLTDLVPDIIPSRETAFFDYMSSYKVYPRTGGRRRAPLDDVDGSDDECDDDRLQRAVDLGDPYLALSLAGHQRRKEKPPPAEVKGLDSWLEKRSPLPRRPSNSFGKTDHSRSSNSKEKEAIEDDRHERREAERPVAKPPQRPKSGFGRTLRSSFSTRRSIVAPPVDCRSPPTTASKRVQSTAKPSKPRSAVPHGPRPGSSAASFGSSVSSRFGRTWGSPAVRLSSSLEPDACSLPAPKSPRFGFGGGNIEHFSLTADKRLTHARGATPGPGTYDRHGG